MVILSFSQIKDKSQIHFLVNLTSKLPIYSVVLSPPRWTRECQVCFPGRQWLPVPSREDRHEAQATRQSRRLKQQRDYCGCRKHRCSRRYQRQFTFGTTYNGQGQNSLLLHWLHIQTWENGSFPTHFHTYTHTYSYVCIYQLKTQALKSQFFLFLLLRTEPKAFCTSAHVLYH